MERLARNAWVFGLLGLLFAIVFGSLRFVLGEVETYGQVFGIAAAICLALYGWLDQERLQAGAESGQRTQRQGSSTHWPSTHSR